MCHKNSGISGNNSREKSYFKSFGAACNVWQVDMKMKDGTLFQGEHESENMLIPTTTKMKEEKSMNWDQILILKYVWQMMMMMMMKSVFACTSQMHLLILYSWERMHYDHADGGRLQIRI